MKELVYHTKRKTSFKVNWGELCTDLDTVDSMRAKSSWPWNLQAYVNTCFIYLVQHHVADGWEPFGFLCAGGHELEAQQEVPGILTLRTRLRQVCGKGERDGEPIWVTISAKKPCCTCQMKNKIKKKWCVCVCVYVQACVFKEAGLTMWQKQVSYLAASSFV